MKYIYTSILIFSVFSMQAQTIIEIDSTLKYQTIDGWEAVANPLEAEESRMGLIPHIDSLISKAINDVGITRLRYSYKSGIEDSVDYFSKMLKEEIDYDEYKTHRYSKINDNDDPFVFNHNGFQLSGFQDNLEKQIIPFKNLVEKNGDQFYFNLCFVDFSDQSEFHHTDNPEEYAEFISYAWYFMDSVYGFTPDGLELILEPDNADKWSRDNIPNSLEAVGNRLKGMGYNPEYIAPSLKSLLGIPQYIEQIAKNQTALDYLDVISYHRYGGNNNTTAQSEIVNLANLYGKKTAMLEYDKNGNVVNLQYDLKHNNVTSWTKYALMYMSDEKFAYVFVDTTKNKPEYKVCKQTKYLRQYFKFIRPGAVRIKATTTDDSIDPIAFSNKHGNQAIVLKAEKGSQIIIDGLKPDVYGIKYTLGNYEWGGVDPKEYDVDLPTQKIAEGEKLEFNMPEKGVVTIYGKVKNQTSNVKNYNYQGEIELIAYDNYVEIINNYYEHLPYSVFSLSGKIVLKGSVKKGTNHIEFSDLTPGIYFVSINKEQFKVLIK